MPTLTEKKNVRVPRIFVMIAMARVSIYEPNPSEYAMDPAFLEATRLWTLALPAVSGFVTAMVRDFQDRDDVLQETAVAVMETFARYDSSQSFTGWAIGVARNQALLHFRRKKRCRLVFDRAALDALATAFANERETNDRLDFLAQCLEHLEAKSLELCRLRYEHDLKPAAIGQRLGMAANAVAKSLQRVRDRLRECVQRKLREATV